MNKKQIVILCAFFAGLTFFAKNVLADQTGVNLIKPEVATALDAATSNIIEGTTVTQAHIGIVHKGQVVYTKSYLKNDVNTHTQDWASVTKMMTKLIIAKLIHDGVISSWDDDVWEYAPLYQYWMPTGATSLSLKNIAAHKAGLPGGSNPSTTANLFTANPSYAPPYTNGGKLIINLSQVGTSPSYYSSKGISILGDVMESSTGKSYYQLVDEYIAAPVGASSLHVSLSPRGNYVQSPNFNTNWWSPAGWIKSTIFDMAKVAAGVVNNAYLTEDEKIYFKTNGFWLGSPSGHSSTYYHTGSNGAAAMSFMIIDPVNDSAAVCLFGGTNEDAQTGLRSPWAAGLIDAINSFSDPLQGGSGADTTAPSAPTGLSVK